MKLIRFTVREFQSIWDSGPINVNEKVTCLVGKNEAGKTALLTALYRTNPIVTTDAAFDETYDYPKREVEDYRFDVESGNREKANVVECEYQLDTEEIEAVAAVFGNGALVDDSVKLSTYYGKNNSNFSINVDDQAALKHLTSNPDFSTDLLSELESVTNWNEISDVLQNTETTDAVNAVSQLVENIKEKGLPFYIFNNLIWPKAPKFLYFDEYYQMVGHANLNQLIQREENNQLEGSDYPLLGLINLARLNHRELVETNNTTELKNKLDGAGNHLTRKIIKYWSQNKHIQMRFDVRDAKPGDPENMQQGINVWGEIYDTVHMAHTSLGSRSRGFVWFFSFLAWYEDVKRKNQNVILLLDEPGLSLHGKAQGDLLKYFDQELSSHQLIYTTHSPFMIDPNRFERVRIVQDLGIDKNEQLPKEQDGTKVVTNILDATGDSIFPLQGALGYEIQQTLFIGPNSLVVEGPSDLLFLKTISSALEREGKVGLSDKWVITPVGGIGKVPTFVSLLAPQSGMNVATLLDFQTKDKQIIEDLYKKKILKTKQVMTYAEFLTINEADIEDLFERDFYLDLVNAEFRSQLNSPLNISDINLNDPRILRSIEAFLADNPLKSGQFNHYRPARYFSEHISKLWSNVSDDTKDRFEAINKRLNGLLK